MPLFKNVSKTPLVGGQWGRATSGKYELIVVAKTAGAGDSRSAAKPIADAPDVNAAEDAAAMTDAAAVLRKASPRALAP